MDLIITGYGKKLYKKDKLIVVKKELKKEKDIQEFPIIKLESIILNKYTSITGGAIQLALKNEVDIMIIDKYGNPYGRFWINRFGSSGKIRINQLKIQDHKTGILLGKNFILHKLKNEIEHLKKINKRRKKKNEILKNGIKKIEEIKKILEDKSIQDKNKIRSYEGNSSRFYYKSLNSILPGRFKFIKRTLHPAKDEINAMLNYAFGILYSKIERALMIAGLDPSIGFFHTSGYNKKPLVYDIIEKYRHIVYKSVFKGLSQKKIRKSWFQIENKGVFINDDGKNFIIKQFYKEYNSKFIYNNRKEKLKRIIQLDCHSLASLVLEFEMNKKEEG